MKIEDKKKKVQMKYKEAMRLKARKHQKEITIISIIIIFLILLGFFYKVVPINDVDVKIYKVE